MTCAAAGRAIVSALALWRCSAAFTWMDLYCNRCQKVCFPTVGSALSHLGHHPFHLLWGGIVGVRIARFVAAVDNVINDSFTLPPLCQLRFQLGRFDLCRGLLIQGLPLCSRAKRPFRQYAPSLLPRIPFLLTQFTSLLSRAPPQPLPTFSLFAVANAFLQV